MMITRKIILNLAEGPTQRLDCTTSTAEKHFTENNKKFSLSLYYNGANS